MSALLRHRYFVFLAWTLLLIISGCSGGGEDGGATAPQIVCVAGGTSYKAELSWEAPATNEDGTSITDLAGYKISYGTSPGEYTETIPVGNVTTYTVYGLSTGTYYFAVRSINSAYDSIFSNEVCKYFD